MIRLTGGVSQRRLDVVRLKVGKVLENFGIGRAASQHSQNVRHANPQPANARSSAAFVRLNGDALKKFHGDRIADSVLKAIVLSPSNTGEETRNKRDAVFALGALEFWVCDRKGRIELFDPRGPITKSHLCQFPANRGYQQR